MSAGPTGKEVQVVGAGPAGLAAAIQLHRLGLAVEVREKRPNVGMRHEGFQGLENWSHDRDATQVLHQLGIAEEFLLRPVHEIHYYGPSRRPFPVRSPDPIFYLVKRGPDPSSLDSALLKQAREAGAVVSFNDPVSTAPAGTIVATGPAMAHAIAAGVVFRTNLRDIAACILDPEVAPGAYAYLLAHEGVATLATMLTRDFAHAHSYLRRAIESFKRLFDFSMSDEREFGGAGNMDITAPVEKGGHLRVGECAGAQDPLWGFGLWFAMETGNLAANCLVEERSYTAAYRKAILPRIRRLIVSRWLFDRLPPGRYDDLLSQLTRLRDVRPAFRKYYTGGPLHTLLFPLARRHYSFQLREKWCHMDDCDCVWCRHGKQDAVPVATE